jgi:ribonuclease D
VITLVDEPSELEPALAELEREASPDCPIGLDTEANGLFAYEARLCIVQLAARERVVVIDALAVDVAPLARLLGPDGPPKVLHDLFFDARMLASRGVALGNVRDTSIMARFLGLASTGLAALLRELLGLAADKSLQTHDWARRPLGQPELAYLADDVRHLAALEAALDARARQADISEEVATACAHRLESALTREIERASYERVKGAHELEPKGRSVLRELFAARDELARKADTPPGRTLRDDVLLALARDKPTTRAGLLRVDKRLARHAEPLLAAVARGLEAGDVPEDERDRFVRRSEPRERVAARRKLERRLSEWRARAAAERGVDEQVVLPGHCCDAVARLGLELGAGLAPRAPDELRQAIASVPGFGDKRARLYAERLAALLLEPS